MASKKSTVQSVANSLKDARRRFLTRYTEVTEGVITITGQRVYHSTLRMDVSREFDEDDMMQRLRFLVKSGVRLGRVLHFGIDVGKTPYILTEWRKLEPVTLALRHHGSPAEVIWQISSQIEKLHRGGMPFGDISEESFLIDSSERVFLFGIPAYGLHSRINPEDDKILDYLPPEHARIMKNGETEDFFAQDSYAIGVCAHHLFARKSFPHPSSSEQLHEYLTGQTPNLLTLYQTVPQWALGLITRCIAWDPEERASVSEIREIARQGTTVRQQLSRAIADIKDFPLPRINWRAVVHPSYRQVTASAIFILAAMVIGYCANTLYQQWKPENLHVDVAQAYDRMDAAMSINALNQYPERPNRGDTTATSKRNTTVEESTETDEDTESADETEVGVQDPAYSLGHPFVSNPTQDTTEKAATKTRKASHRKALRQQEQRRISNFQRFAATLTTPPTEKSRLWPTPQRELIALLSRNPLLPKTQFYTVAQELYNRATVTATQKVAILALLHLDPTLIPAKSARALISLVDGTFQSAQVAELTPMMVEDIDYVLAAITAQSPYPSTALQAYLALNCRPIQAEGMAALLSIAKRQKGTKTASEIQAIGMLALGQFADLGERSRAFYRLLDRSQPIDVLLFENGTSFGNGEAPWCPLVEL